MKLISWNVNGLRAVRKKGFADFVRRAKADVICLQEPKIGSEQTTEVDLSHPGYSNQYSLAIKKGYSGVLNYIREGVPLDQKKSCSGLGIPRFDREGRVVLSMVEDLRLYNIYFPSGTTGEVRQDFKYDFLAAVLKHLKALKKSERERTILCGDFNICHREIDIHHPQTASRQELSGFLPEERAWLDQLEAAGFIDSFRHVHGEKPDKYSWWSYRAGARDKNLGWRIDYFWTAKALAPRITGASILNRTTGSDHCPVVLELN